MHSAPTDFRLKSLILEKLDAPYTSMSTNGHTQLPTGNHYQSVKLGDQRTRGFRNDRAEILDQIDFTNKKVLDLGSNLGELSREARARGARLVDGFEADAYFIELAEMINAFNRTTQVAFHQRDITDPLSYEEEYDLVLAFSVFTYISACLPRIAEITNVLVIETHKLDGNFDGSYLDPVLAHYPHFRILGASDWGATVDADGARAIVMFAKREEDLLETFRAPEARNGAVEATVALQSGVRRIDVARTCLELQGTFFGIFDVTFDSSDHLLRAIDGMELNLESLEDSPDLKRLYGGWLYWLLYLKGYCQYRRSGEIGPGNIYFDYLVRHPDLDPGIADQLADAETTRTYVARQYRDMDLCRFRTSESEVQEAWQPVLVYSSADPAEDEHRVYENARPAPIPARWVDGWHRLFAAKVFGVSRLPCEFVQETDAVGPIYGEIEDVRVDESTVELEGWCIDPDARIDGIELRADEGIAQTSMRIWSEEAARAFPRVSQEASSGFVVKSKWKEEADSPAALEVVALRDQLPIGRMSFRLLPDMFEEGTWPEAELARRLWGTGNSRALAIRGSNCAYDLLTTLGRYRSLESFGSVLDWGCGVGLLQPFLGSYLPDATITGIDFDEDAVQWCRRAGFAGTFSATGVLPPTELPPESFDLVLGNAILPRLRREEQLAWLQELSRLMKSRAYAALSVNGELVRPLLKDADAMTELDREGIYTRPTEPGPASRVGRVATYQTEVFTRQACAGLFDVVVYAAGGVYNQQDLLILRKR